MFEEQPQQTNSTISTVRTGLAVIFFVLAIPLGIWVLSIVNTTINDAKSPVIVQKIIPEEVTADINTPAGKFGLPKPVFTGLSYFILYLFLLIPTSIAIALLKGSVNLLNPDMTKQLRRLIASIAKSPTPRQ